MLSGVESVRRKIVTAKFKQVFLLFGIVLIASVSYSQKNLVPNGGFEAHKNKRNTSITNAAPWKGVATVDYYLQALKLDTSRYHGPHSGEASVGLRFQLGYKEFLYVKLIDPLKAGKVYHFESYFRLLSISTMGLKHLGVFFSKKPFSLSDKVDTTNSVYMYERKGLVGDYNWIKLEGDYTAKGGERYITLGNFTKKTKQDMYRLNRNKLFAMFHEAYYFVDDASLVEKIDSVTLAKMKEQEAKKIPPPVVKNELKAGDVIQLKSIFFETAKAELVDDSYPELDKLVDLLEKNPTMEVQINGHTDNQGNDEANQKLSEARAKAVFDYLIEKGISNEIDFKGYGSAKPIANNNTDEGRKQNRRVEFEITKY
jgi:OOP family OmpA-OmpF porin